MPSIRIEAIDTLFFRDGRPFSMGEETFATGIFPPPPSVLYGALRSAYASENGIFDSSSIENETKDLNIKSLYFKSDGDFLFPCPFDIVEAKVKKQTVEENRQERNREIREKTYLVEQLKIEKRPNISNLLSDLEFFYKADKHIESIKNGLFDDTQLYDYLNNSMGNEIKIRKWSDFLKIETKIGIGRENTTKQSQDGNLYRIDMKRILNNVSLNCNFDFDNPDKNSNIKKEGLLKLGGEGKIAKYVTPRNRDVFDFDSSKIIFSGNCFKLYLATPAFFANGYFPDIGKTLGIKAKLLALCTDRAINIGGFDMVKKEPKTMLKAIPAGSIFCFETDEEGINIIKQSQGISISEISNEYIKQGYGIAYFGNF